MLRPAPLAASLLLSVGVLLSGCSSSSGGETAGPVEPVDVSDPSGAPTRGDYFQDLKGSQKQCPTATVEGLDVYDGNGSVDWPAMYAAGVRFTVLKATQGTYNAQKRFGQNWADAKSAQMLRGAYHFFDPTEDGVLQAKFFLKALGGEAGELPAVIDLECPNSDAHCLGGRGAGKASGKDIARRLQDWLDTVEQATGRKPIIYTFGSYLTGAGVTMPNLKSYPLWIASPGSGSCTSVPSPWTQASIWQWSFHGKVAGHAGDLDRDRFLGTMDDLLKFAGGGSAQASCASDADCNGGHAGTGKICDGKSHQCGPGCHADTDCLAGQACDQSSSGSSCVAASKGGCATDGDCGSGQVCSVQTAACIAAPTPACTSDATCSGGKPGTGKICSAQSKKCESGCHADSDCLGKQVCNTASSTCTTNTSFTCKSDADCGSGQVCNGSSSTCGAAPPPPCKADSECNKGKAGTGKVCSSQTGSCVVGCHADSDCLGGQSCDTGASACVTTPPPGGCQTSADCAAGKVCSAAGSCVAPNTSGCMSSADCGAGQVCDISGTCVGAPTSCQSNADCQGGKICDGSGACVAPPPPGCQSNADCAAGQICNGSGACVAAPPPGCMSNADCAAGHICNASGVCVTGPPPGCQSNADCAAGQICNGSGACVAAPPPGCQSNADCAAGQICNGSGACVAAPPPGCMSDADCATGQTCDTMSGMCMTGSTSGCPALTFPSGQTLATVPDAALTAEYQALGVASCTLPTCFIDAANLTDASGTAVDVHAKLSAHFALYEIIQTEIDPNGTGGLDAVHAYSTRVLVSPDLVAHLETLRVDYGGPVNLTSGFRSPAHQRAVCQQVCGADSCTDGSGTVTCAKNSRHMWGAAADMGLMYESAANQASFAFVFHEGGGTAPHLHVDMQSCN